MGFSGITYEKWDVWGKVVLYASKSTRFTTNDNFFLETSRIMLFIFSLTQEQTQHALSHKKSAQIWGGDATTKEGCSSEGFWLFVGGLSWSSGALPYSG